MTTRTFEPVELFHDSWPRRIGHIRFNGAEWDGYDHTGEWRVSGRMSDCLNHIRGLAGLGPDDE